ncbi:HPF/RaiA family ribosome-associated protein [Ectothiorhodospiraceae bacterium 2226]|nr:HPF/RaiA family ribosome-associated protein [Ectothiorhodospiraceae bacterium 2226]
MQIPLQVTFRNMDTPPALEADVREKAAKLDEFCPDIMSCRVVVEAQHKHHHAGNLYHVRVDLTVPGRELVVSRERDQHHAHEDPYVAVRDAFDAARRQLQDYEHRRQRHVKRHEPPSHGRILEINPAQDFGRIETSDGRDVYFHRNSVLDADFDRLDVGTEVRFDEEMGEQGPQASTVHVIGKHHIPG